MEIFGYNRKGFLYIDNGNTLISQQTTSDESNMVNKYASLPEFKDFDEARAIWSQYESIRNASVIEGKAKFHEDIF
jgi:hypothetical protein